MHLTDLLWLDVPIQKKKIGRRIVHMPKPHLALILTAVVGAIIIRPDNQSMFSYFKVLSGTPPRAPLYMAAVTMPLASGPPIVRHCE